MKRSKIAEKCRDVIFQVSERMGGRDGVGWKVVPAGVEVLIILSPYSLLKNLYAVLHDFFNKAIPFLKIFSRIRVGFDKRITDIDF